MNPEFRGGTDNRVLTAVGEYLRNPFVTSVIGKFRILGIIIFKPRESNLRESDHPKISLVDKYLLPTIRSEFDFNSLTAKMS